MSMCNHNKLTALNIPTAIDYEVDKRLVYFVYKKYVCDECHGTIVILNAVLEPNNEFQFDEKPGKIGMGNPTCPDTPLHVSGEAKKEE